ncbi:MAG: RHS repeat-associated core domain-containing protein, partial [Calditrichaeota bacterium]
MVSSRFSEELIYEVDGNIDTLIFVQDNLTDSYEFEYDGVSRLLKSRALGNILRSEAYLYDKNGNILGMNKTSSQEPTQNYFYYTGTNKLNHVDTQSNNNYAYDNTGNIISDDENNLIIEYDYRNLPKSHNIQTGSSALFSYDASGLRVSKVLNGDLMDYYYTGDPEYNYLIRDYLGSVRMVLDEAGNVTENYWYSPYGEVIDATVTGQSPSELKFTGHEEENEGLPGFYYAGARYYNSCVGIWYSTDPAGQTASPYLYAGNNPLIYTDPNGLW